MGHLISFFRNITSYFPFNNPPIKQKFIGPEYMDFEGLFMFFKVNRFYEDGFLEILIRHNLYGNYESLTRCLRVYGLNPIRFPEFIKLLISKNSEGFVKVHKDRGLLLLGSVYIANENRGYTELKTMLPEIEKIKQTDEYKSDEKGDNKDDNNNKIKDLEIIDIDEYEHFNG